MKKYSIIIIVLVVLIVIAMIIDMTKLYSSDEKVISKTVETFDVELEDVLNKPQLYSDKIIKVKGYYHTGFEKSSLSTINDSQNAIWIELLTTDTIIFTLNNQTHKIIIEDSPFEDSNIFNDRFIEVVGRFDDKDKGHEEGYIGTIKELVYFKILTELDSSNYIK